MGALLGLPIEWGTVLTFVVVVAIVRVVARPGPVPVRLWSAVGMLVAYWSLLAIARALLGESGNERYLYPGALFALLVVLELLRGVSLPRRAWPLVALGFPLITLTNVGFFQGQINLISERNHAVAVSVTALQVAGPTPIRITYPTRCSPTSRLDLCWRRSTISVRPTTCPR